MEFDINRVYTVLNADEVKPGSKCFFADSLNRLKQCVKGGDCPKVLDKVLDEDYIGRFIVGDNTFMLAYLVYEPNKPRRMTNRELARWLAQGNGQWLGTANGISTSYSYGSDNKEIPDTIKIRGWDEAEWREPIIQEE